MTEITIIFLVNLFASISKKWIKPRFGKTGVQVVVFILSVLAALYYTFPHPSLSEFVAITVGVLTMSITFYELLWSKLPSLTE